MGQKADEISEAFKASLDPATQRRFYIDAGDAWKSDKKNTLFVKKPMTVHVGPGDIVLRHAQVFHGAPPGWPDFCGWDSVTITPEMVGKTLAVFCGDEIKSPNDRLRPLQKLLRDCLTRMGGRWRKVSRSSSV